MEHYTNFLLFKCIKFDTQLKSYNILHIMEYKKSLHLKKKSYRYLVLNKKIIFYNIPYYVYQK